MSLNTAEFVKFRDQALKNRKDKFLKRTNQELKMLPEIVKALKETKMVNG
jgi:hypothetical protein